MDAQLIAPALLELHAPDVLGASDSLPELDPHTLALLDELECVLTRPTRKRPMLTLQGLPLFPFNVPLSRALKRPRLHSTAVCLPPRRVSYMAGQFEDKLETTIAMADTLSERLTTALARRSAWEVGGTAGWTDGTSSSFFGYGASVASSLAPMADGRATPLHAFMSWLVVHTPVSRSVFVLLVVLLDRVRRADAALSVCAGNVRRVVAAALAVASKMVEDEPPSNCELARAAGVGSTEEMNMLEIEFLRRIEWRCAVPRKVFRVYEAELFQNRPDLCAPLAPADAPGSIDAL